MHARTRSRVHSWTVSAGAAVLPYCRTLQFGMYLRRMALLHAELMQWSAAHDLLLLAAEQ
jgi:hypothetical protein